MAEIIRVVGAAIVEAPAQPTETVDDTRQASSVLRRRAGRCLVTQRGRGMSNPLEWEFPGGKVEAGEDLAQALVREIREELGVEIEVGERLGSTRTEVGTADRPRRIVLHVFICRWLAGEIRLAEHEGWRWVDADGLSSLLWSKADRPLLDALKDHLEGG